MLEVPVSSHRHWGLYVHKVNMNKMMNYGYHSALHGEGNMNEIHNRKRDYFFQYKHSDSVFCCYLLKKGPGHNLSPKDRSVYYR